jgi:hypothetical protein
MASHRAPYYSVERTTYFESCMDEFAKHGGRHLVFTPPTTRGSNITRCEAWALNLQRDCVPTLTEAGRWPLIQIDAHPKTMSREQSEWLSKFWGDCARKWVEAGCPGAAIKDFDAAKKERAHKEYAALVMSKFREAEHADKCTFLERKASVEHAARQRL